MDYIRDRFGNILRKDSYVAYVYNGLIERGRVIRVIRIGQLSEIVRVEIEPFKENAPSVTRPPNQVMSVILPAT